MSQYCKFNESNEYIEGPRTLPKNDIDAGVLNLDKASAATLASIGWYEFQEPATSYDPNLQTLSYENHAINGATTCTADPVYTNKSQAQQRTDLLIAMDSYISGRYPNLSWRSILSGQAPEDINAAAEFNDLKTWILAVNDHYKYIYEFGGTWDFSQFDASDPTVDQTLIYG